MMARKYETPDEFLGELETMCANAFTYNEDDSEVFKDAQQIKVSHGVSIQDETWIVDTVRTLSSITVTTFKVVWPNHRFRKSNSPSPSSRHRDPGAHPPVPSHKSTPSRSVQLPDQYKPQVAQGPWFRCLKYIINNRHALLSTYLPCRKEL